jgi:hypothetical protein
MGKQPLLVQCMILLIAHFLRLLCGSSKALSPCQSLTRCMLLFVSEWLFDCLFSNMPAVEYISLNCPRLLVSCVRRFAMVKFHATCRAPKLEGLSDGPYENTLKKALAHAQKLTSTALDAVNLQTSELEPQSGCFSRDISAPTPWKSMTRYGIVHLLSLLRC